MEDHQKRVVAEFSRQAEAMESARFFNDADVLARILEAAALTRESRALDVACGPGIVAEALARFAGDVIACDITPAMLARASRRFEKSGLNNVRCVAGRAESLPFDDGSFDVVVTRAALHHFPHVTAALGEIARVLRVSGRAVILDSTSSENAEESALHNALETLRDPSHIRMLPKSELLALMPVAGLAPKTLLEWTNGQDFDEWLKTTNAPERAGPLRIVMTALANTGLHAGINLRLESGRLLFEHHRLLVVAEKHPLTQAALR
jgi:ubiquinone/menaquinone biosynthesis C-methylase UbiE